MQKILEILTSNLQLTEIRGENLENIFLKSVKNMGDLTFRLRFLPKTAQKGF